MQKYAYDLYIEDKLLVNNAPVVIDRFILLKDSIIVDGYYEDSGEDFMQEYDLDDIVQCI